MNSTACTVIILLDMSRRKNMKYAYYQSVPDGKVTYFHQVDPEWSEEKIKQQLSEFNEKNKQTCNAVVIDVEEDSFIDFLIHKARERTQINKEILEELDNALSEASAIVNNLRYGG